jgi:hypothetical protein
MLDIWNYGVSALFRQRLVETLDVLEAAGC